MNHAAIIAKVESLHPIEGADRIQLAKVLGEQVVVSIDWEVDLVGVFFPPDCQLSEDYCYYNNLYRHSDKNSNKDAKGFFDDNRSVRCQPFLKNRSEGYFSSLNSLEYTGVDIGTLKLGEQFQELNGQNICKRYYSDKALAKLKNKNTNKKKERVIDTPLFNKHVNTLQFKYEAANIPKGSLINIHHKVHGTSARYSLTKVVRTPTSFKEKFLNVLGLFKSESWEYLAGTRNVVLYSGQENKDGFHGAEGFRFQVLEQLKPFLEKGMTVYGELSGFANGKTIMPKHKMSGLKDKKYNKKYGKEICYSYGCKEHETRFHVYRISITDEEGVERDFSEEQVQAWCSNKDINGPLQLVTPFVYDGNVEALCNKVEQLTELPETLTEDVLDPSHISEGVVIRVDYHSFIPKFYKNKSYAFKVLEGIASEVEVDLEEVS